MLVAGRSPSEKCSPHIPDVSVSNLSHPRLPEVRRSERPHPEYRQAFLKRIHSPHNAWSTDSAYVLVSRSDQHKHSESTSHHPELDEKSSHNISIAWEEPASMRAIEQVGDPCEIGIPTELWAESRPEGHSRRGAITSFPCCFPAFHKVGGDRVL